MEEQDRQTISQKLDRVLYILENDDKTNRKGLVEEVADIKFQVSELLNREKVYNAKATLLGVFGASLFTVISWVFEHFFFNKK